MESAIVVRSYLCTVLYAAVSQGPADTKAVTIEPMPPARTYSCRRVQERIKIRRIWTSTKLLPNVCLFLVCLRGEALKNGQLRMAFAPWNRANRFPIHGPAVSGQQPNCDLRKVGGRFFQIQQRDLESRHAVVTNRQRRIRVGARYCDWQRHPSIGVPPVTGL